MFSTLMLLAQDPAPTGGPGGGLGSLLIPLVLMLGVFYFLMIMPARRQEKQRQAMIGALKKNDRVVNSGGIIGVVDSIKEKEDEVVLKGGIRILKSSIQRVIPPEEPAKEA